MWNVIILRKQTQFCSVKPMLRRERFPQYAIWYLPRNKRLNYRIIKPYNTKHINIKHNKSIDKIHRHVYRRHFNHLFTQTTIWYENILIYEWTGNFDDVLTKVRNQFMALVRVIITKEGRQCKHYFYISFYIRDKKRFNVNFF